eukprot:1796892-Rhodomonas_salina.2
MDISAVCACMLPSCLPSPRIEFHKHTHTGDKHSCPINQPSTGCLLQAQHVTAGMTRSAEKSFKVAWDAELRVNIDARRCLRRFNGST